MKPLLLAAILLAMPAFADHVKPYPDASIIRVPPPEYDPRVRGVPRAIVKYIPHADMYRICSNNGANANIGPGVLACAKLKIKTIYLPIGMATELRNAVLRHERGHMLGWRHETSDVQAVYEDGH